MESGSIEIRPGNSGVILSFWQKEDCEPQLIRVLEDDPRLDLKDQVSLSFKDYGERVKLRDK
jgi:hypothetical protein